MAVINIMGVTTGSKSFTVHVVLTEDQNPDDPEKMVVFGEAFLEMPEGIEMEDVKSRIIDAAQGILKKHQDSVDKKEDILELDFPPII